MVDDAGPDTKKSKTEDKGDSEEGTQAPEETENNGEKPDDEEEDSEVPSLPLGLTGNLRKFSTETLNMSCLLDSSLKFQLWFLIYLEQLYAIFFFYLAAALST